MPHTFLPQSIDTPDVIGTSPKWQLFRSEATKFVDDLVTNFFSRSSYYVYDLINKNTLTCDNIVILLYQDYGLVPDVCD